MSAWLHMAYKMCGLGSIRRLLFGFIFSAGIAALLLFLFYFIWSLSFDLHQVGHIPERSWIYDKDGNVYSRLYGENRILLESNQISPLFKRALLAREDSRFFEHHGIDLVGVFRAVTSNLAHLTLLQGGSTITQQLARNSFDLGGKTLSRKILEAFVALRIEQSFSKDQILAFYTNRIYFGSGYYGLETASQAYFGKPASTVNLTEAATLAGLIRSPNRYSPLKNPNGATTQRNEVLDRMAELKMITAQAAEAAKSTPLKIAARRSSVPQQNYAMDALYRELQGIVSQDQIDAGGLRIYTTLDPVLQPAAESAIENWLEQVEKKTDYKHPRKLSYTDAERAADDPTPYLQGATLVLDNRSGGIRALVGGRDFRDSKFNRTLQAYRPIGSTFKPFVYAAAYGQGLFPGTQISDGPLQPGEVHSAPRWAPNNSDGTNRGTLPARDGLIFSRNTMTVRVGEKATLDKVHALATLAGLATDIPKVPAIYLGAFGSTVKDVTAAYSAFAAGGVRREPYIVERIDDQDGTIIYQAHPQQRQILSPAIAWMVAQTLRGVIERGTAASAKSLGLDRIAAGKTGTTDEYKDAWFVGFTNSLTCGVWVGFDQPQTIEQKGYGAALALPIWVRIMEKASRQQYADGEFPPPEKLVQVQLCSVSNQLATSDCQAAGTTYQVALPQSMCPQQSCSVHQGRLLNPDEEPTWDEGNFPQRFFRSLRNLFGR
jgi:penicillin-binding protein 1A